MKLIKVEPERYVNQVAFVEPGGMQVVREPVYPSSPRGDVLEATMRQRNLGYRALSQRTKLRASEISGLITGRLTMSETDWDDLMRGLDQ